MQEEGHPFDEAFSKAVDLGNQIADDDDKADLWDIADGLLAGAVQYWLYSRQPCGDPALRGMPADQHGASAHRRVEAAGCAVLRGEPVLPHADGFERGPRVRRPMVAPVAALALGGLLLACRSQVRPRCRTTIALPSTCAARR